MRTQIAFTPGDVAFSKKYQQQIRLCGSINNMYAILRVPAGQNITAVMLQHYRPDGRFSQNDVEPDLVEISTASPSGL